MPEPLIPGNSPEPQKSGRKELDEAQFARIRRSHILRVIAIVLTMVPVTLVAILNYGFWFGLIVLGFASPLVYQLWSRVFSGARLFGSPVYTRFREDRKRVRFREQQPPKEE